MKALPSLFIFPFLFVLALSPVIALEETASESPDKLFEIIKSSDKQFEDAGVVTVFDRIRTEYLDSGAAVTVEEVLLHFRDSSEAVSFRSLHYEFNPRTADIEFLEAAIYKADGTTVINIPMEQIQTHNAPANSIYWNFDIVICPVPRMEDGDALYYRIRRQGLNLAYLDDSADEPEFKFVPPHAGFFMDTVYFQEHHPIIEKTYTITGPRSKPLQFAMANGTLDVTVRFDESSWFYTFSARDVEAWEEEPFDDGYEETALKLALASHPSWEMKSKWAYEHNEPQFVISDAMREKTRKIIEGCSDDECKMFRLLHWVAEEVRYLGLDMGEGEGHMVHPTDSIFTERAGVCKDKAAVLVSMLRAAGFESYFVMTLAMERTLDIPADDKFNHGVVAVRNSDGTWTFLDPTWAPQNRPLFNYLEQEQPVLIAAPEGQPLRHIPYSPPSESPLTVKAETSLFPDGSATIDMNISTDGFIDAEFRRPLSWMDPITRDSYFRSFIEQISPAAELLTVSFSDPLDFNQPVAIHMKARLTDAATRIGDKLYLNPPLTRHIWSKRWESDYLHAGDGPEQRKHGLELDCTRLIRFEENLHMPDGFRLKETPKAVTIEGKTIEGHYSVESRGSDHIEIHQTIAIKRRVTPAEDYPELRKAIETLKDIRKTTLVLESDGKAHKTSSATTDPVPSPEFAPVSAADAGARINLKETTVTFTANGMTERFYTDVVVYNEKGRDEFADETYVLNTSNQTIRCIECYVITPDGTRIDSPETAINTTLEPEAVTASDYSNIFNFTVSHIGIEYGSRLVTTVERETRFTGDQNLGMSEFIFMPASDYPADSVRFSITVPPEDEILFEGFNTDLAPVVSNDDQGNKSFIWGFSQVAAARWERHSGSFFLNEPFIVVLNGAVKNWEARAAALRKVLFASQPYHESLATVTQNLIEEEFSEQEKLDAILQFISEQITQVDIPPQRFLMQTRLPERTLETGYGHSYDRLALLNAMIESAGGKCEIGLSGFRWSISERIPAIRTMTDILLRLTLGRTEKIASLDGSPVNPGQLVDRSILWIGRDSEYWTRDGVWRESVVTDSGTRMNLSLEIESDRSVTGSAEFCWSGYWNVGDEACDHTPEWIRKCLPEWLKNPEVTVLDVFTLNPLTGTTRIRASFKGNAEFDSFHDGIIEIGLPSCPFGMTSENYQFNNGSKRELPVILNRAGQLVDHVRITLPEDWKLVLTPEDIDMKESFGYLHQKVTRDGQSLILKRECMIEDETIPAALYPAFTKMWRMLTRSGGRRVLVETAK